MSFGSRTLSGFVSTSSSGLSTSDERASAPSSAASYLCFHSRILERSSYLCGRYNASLRCTIRTGTAAWTPSKQRSISVLGRKQNQGNFDKNLERSQTGRTFQAGAPILLLIVPALAAIGIASFLGKLVLATVTTLAGISIFFAAGITAFTVLLPATLFIGTILSVAAFFGSLSVGAVLSLAAVSFFATKRRRQKIVDVDFDASQQKFAEFQKREKEERADLDKTRSEREELLEFDRRLNARRKL